MKVGLIIEGTYPWYMGGVSEWVYQYLSHLGRHDFYILQIATDEYRNLDLKHGAYSITPNVRDFKRIPVPPLELIDEGYFDDWYKEWQEEIKILSETDVIHVTNTGFAGLLGAYLKKKWQKPLLLTEHAIYWKEVELGTRALECGYTIPELPGQIAFFVDYFRRTAEKTYQNADIVVSVSRYNIPYQAELGVSDVIHIPNGVPSEFIADLPKQFREVPVIGWVGRCSDLKNPVKFIEFIEACNQMDCHVKGLMLLAQSGEEQLEEEVRSRAERVKNLTCIWNQKSFSYYDQMDFLCLTSKHESQPLVLFEAIARGVIPSGWEVGDADKEYGIFVRPNQSHEDLCSEMVKILQNAELREEIIANLQFKIKSRHTWERIFKQYENILCQLKRENIDIPKLR